MVEDRPEPERPLQVPPPPCDLVELLVAVGEIGRGERVVRGPDEPFAIEVGVLADRRLVDAQLLVLGPPAEPGEAGGGAQLAAELAPALPRPLASPADPTLQLGAGLAP